jgi:hypothetical protein
MHLNVHYKIPTINKGKSVMSKKFIKNIVRASAISLIFLGGAETAWGMWNELEEQDQHRIVKAHILDMTKPGEYHLENRSDGRKMIPVQVFVPHVPIHTGGWIDNWPELTIENTCSTCKQDITTTHQTKIVPQKLRDQQLKILQMGIELENLKLKNKNT